MRALVLGVGNVLLSDEGVGVHAAAMLERSFRFPDAVEILDGGTAGIELLRHIAGRDLLVIIDAMSSGAEPGSVLRLSGGEVPARMRSRISPHQLGLSDLLAAAALTGEMPGETVLYGIEPENLEPGLELSPAVARACGEVVEAVAAELAARGLAPVVAGDAGTAGKRFWEEVAPQ